MLQNSESVLKLKTAAIELLLGVPCKKITVAMVLERSGVARRTFYKYFENMGSLWHSLSHDTVLSIETMSGMLTLEPGNHHSRSQRSNIQRMVGLSSTEMAKYMADYLMKHELLIQCLVVLDPYFLNKWKEQTASLFREVLLQGGYTMERSNRIAGLLSKSLVDGCITAVKWKDRQAIIENYIAVYDILYVLCEHQERLCAQKKSASFSA